jgi:hypothetical protein
MRRHQLTTYEKEYEMAAMSTAYPETEDMESSSAAENMKRATIEIITVIK